MTSNELAKLLNARKYRAGRWMAKCPVHDDKTPSLSINAGREGRTLLHCWAGCPTEDILEKLGLQFRDLFEERLCGPNEIRAANEARARREALANARRSTCRDVVDRYRRLTKLLDIVGRALAFDSEGSPRSDVRAALFHDLLERVRDLEVQLEDTSK